MSIMKLIGYCKRKALEADDKRQSALYTFTGGYRDATTPCVGRDMNKTPTSAKQSQQVAQLLTSILRRRHWESKVRFVYHKPKGAKARFSKQSGITTPDNTMDTIATICLLVCVTLTYGKDFSNMAENDEYKMFGRNLLMHLLKKETRTSVDREEKTRFASELESLDDVLETTKRKNQIFESNLEFIRRHNLEAAIGKHTYTLGVNEFSDMTHDEFKRRYLGYKMPKDVRESAATYIHTSTSKRNIRDTLDWREEGLVTPVKNQGQCGSDWAFSATGALEGQHFRKTGQLVSLSEQNLIDCTKSYGNQGCHGGWMDDAFKYIRDNKGIDTEVGYPYYARDLGYCYYNAQYNAATDKGFVDIKEGDEDALLNAVATIGPISAAIDAKQPSFMSYQSGVYYEPNCGSNMENLDHAVLVVGYGSQFGTDYWLVKNSWGAHWGDQGYIKMARNRGNQCGIATKASYPLFSNKMPRVLSAAQRFLGIGVKSARFASCTRSLSILSEDILKTDVKEWRNDTVVFSWQGEDHRPITRALDIKEGSTIFSIASAGYNPSMLLLDNPAKVIIADIDPTQVAWCMLYFSAIKHLSYEEFRGLVGFGEGSATTPDERGRIYDSLRRSLPDKALKYWDGHRNAVIKSGMYRFGHYIRVWGLERFAPIAHSQETLDKFLSISDIEEQRVFFEEQWNTWRWRRAFTEAHLNISPFIYYPYWDFLPKLAPLWLNNFREICLNVPNMDNPQIEMHLTAKISGKYSIPDFWKPENFIPIRERLDAFELVHADANEYFRTTTETFDGFVLSNVGDAFNKVEHDDWVSSAIKRGKPGSRITYLSVVGTDKGWPDGDKGRIHIEQELSEDLMNGTERGFLWDHLHIATIK
ncbi:unnamed protein product [Owenia fusiformis]|uniref:Uncharacterized protein n=1 Tax=Owenia fusiformis TaxID=6347 RepID=A0A8S4P9X0_OWEFU|nr:unnamed protein product [Owenia fusiformis]